VFVLLSILTELYCGGLPVGLIDGGEPTRRAENLKSELIDNSHVINWEVFDQKKKFLKI
jgi:hypothetical protein